MAGRGFLFTRVVALAVVAVSCLSGCKTSDDATAAAAQMQETAKTLSDYYAAVGATFAKTDEMFVLEAALMDKPYSETARGLMKDNEAEVAKRVALAADLSALAGSFAKLTGADAGAELSAAAVKCETEIDALAARTASSTEQGALKAAVQMLAQAVQQRKEREAAKAVDAVAKELSAFFAKEAPVWSSSERVYLQQSVDVANYLLEHDGIDGSGVLKVALEPLGLEASGNLPAEVKAKLAPLAKQQMVERSAARSEAFERATAAMSEALQEMSRRVDAVAEEKPMRLRFAPVTLATVEQWAARVSDF